MDRERDGVGRRGVTLPEVQVAQLGRQGGGIHRPICAQHIHARRDQEPSRGCRAAGGVAPGYRLHRKRRAEIGKHHRHGPGAADRAGYDFRRTGHLEWISHRYRIGVHLEAPDTGTNLVQEVDPLALVAHHGGAAVSGDPLKRCRFGRDRAGGAGVEESVPADQLG